MIQAIVIAVFISWMALAPAKAQFFPMGIGGGTAASTTCGSGNSNGCALLATMGI